MNYELAKELKDAGFPQKESGGRYTEQDPPAGGTLYEFSTSITRNDNVYKQIYVPTLSELIEACGTSIEKIERKENWIVSGHSLNKKLDWEYHNDLYENYVCEALTIEEAVARLWLALNQPSTMNK